MNRELLEKPFPPEAVRQREGNFGHLVDYIEGHSVIQRLNDALEGGWSFEVLEHRVFESLDEVLVLGRLSTHGLVKSQFGASGIKRNRETQEVICMADAFKAAATDALKKCATLLGVGLDLYAGMDEQPARKAENSRHTFPGGAKPQLRQPTSHKANADSNGRVTAKQHRYLLSLAKDHGMTTKQLNAHCVQAYGAGLDFIKRKEASALIESLNNKQPPMDDKASFGGHLN